MLSLPLAHIQAKFILDGEKYDVEDFKINFSQPVDHKGQPQHEMKGGQIMVSISQIPGNNMYQWAKKATELKGGSVIFQTDLGISVLRVTFSNAYCVSLTRDISAITGTKTTLYIAPEKVSLNGIEHNNFWSK